MEAEFWQQRWREGRIGFHQDRITPLLLTHWDAIATPASSQVFVPLCGKTLDMTWLAGRGHRVLGVELSALAIQQFFDEQHLSPECRDSRYGRHYTAGPFELICGDAFALDASVLAGCGGVYDRAALIALPPGMRREYAATSYASLPTGCRGLLVTIDYPPHEKIGPPFPVDAEEVNSLFQADWQVDVLERRDILAKEPGFVADGVTRLHTTAYRLERK